MTTETTQILSSNGELDAENLERIASQIEDLKNELEAGIDTPEIAVETLEVIERASGFLDLITGNVGLDPVATLEEGERVLKCLDNSLSEMQSIEPNAGYKFVSLQHFENVGNNLVGTIKTGLALFIQKKHKGIGETVEKFMQGEDMSNEDTFLGPELSRFYSDILKTVGLDIDGNLIDASKAALQREIKDLSPLVKIGRSIKSFIVTRIFKKIS